VTLDWFAYLSAPVLGRSAEDLLHDAGVRRLGWHASPVHFIAAGGQGADQAIFGFGNGYGVAISENVRKGNAVAGPVSNVQRQRRSSTPLASR
jgi:hypothetical protein